MRRPILGPLLLRRAAQLGLVLLLLFVLSEMALRQLDRRGYVALGAPGQAAQRLFVAVGDSYLATNPVDYSESEFPVVKPPGVWRMFILGDSFAKSFPYQYECSMADWIAQGLKQRFCATGIRGDQCCGRDRRLGPRVADPGRGGGL